MHSWRLWKARCEWIRRVIVAKGTKRCQEALCLIKSVLICTANFTFTVKDAEGEALRRTHEIFVSHPNYNTTDERLQEVGRELEHERRKA